MRIVVDTAAKHLSVRNASRLLGDLALLRDAAAGPEEFLEGLRFGGLQAKDARDMMEQAGALLEKESWPVLPEAAYALFRTAAIERSAGDDGPYVSRLTAGSADVVIQEWGKRAAGRLRSLLRAASVLVGSADRAEFKTAARALTLEAPGVYGAEQARRTMGLAVIAGGALASTLGEMGATAVKVTDEGDVTPPRAAAAR